jgi:lycopene beta-cyclase
MPTLERDLTADFDYLLVGGGLQNGLIALAVAAAQPAARIAIVERGSVLGGNHTWCFHDTDLPADSRRWVDPLIGHRWASHEVAFPAHHRVLEGGYAGISSDHFARVVTAALAGDQHAILLGTEAVTVGAHEVEVATGGQRRRLRAGTVVDARGPDRGAGQVADAGYQVFWGREIATDGPHGVTRPMLMDATVEQVGGYRFVYVLPLAADRLLVEDTYFADGAALDGERLGARIDAYVAAHGWRVARVVREESGVLPLPWRMDVAPLVDDGPIVAGYQGGFFHPVTGYSFPIALRLARAVATGDRDAVRAVVRAQRRQLGFALRLNKMLFRWFAPERRYHVLERFYRLPEPTIRRFYALELTALDRARILVGRPPRGLSWRAALGAGPPSSSSTPAPSEGAS